MNLRDAQDRRDYKCIVLSPEGRQYNLDHEWKGKTIFGFILYYQCLNCCIKISRKEFKINHYIEATDKHSF